jgi:hypothetical protein
MKRAPMQTSPPLPVPDTPRPRATMRGKRHFLNLEGEAAAQAGLPDTSVPYSAGSLENIGWLEGWARARAVVKTS